MFTFTENIPTQEGRPAFRGVTDWYRMGVNKVYDEKP
jgi:hypothetical protein